MLDELDLSGVTDPEARRILGLLLNVIAAQAAEIAPLRAENQRLRDEVTRLKGEQGAPTLLPSCPPSARLPLMPASGSVAPDACPVRAWTNRGHTPAAPDPLIP